MISTSCMYKVSLLPTNSSHTQLPTTNSTSKRFSAGRATSSSTASAPPRRQCCFSFAAYARALMNHLRRCGVRVDPGLSEAELKRVESQLGFAFPPDLRAILQEGLPTGCSFPNWRSSPASDLRNRMQQPLTELCAEVRRNRFWLERWGIRPLNHEQAAKVAVDKLRTAPLLVPVYGNCFIPATESAGNPVLLVQSGVVSVFGNDLADFFEKEVFSADHQTAAEIEDDEDGGSVQSSCLMGSMKNSSSSSSSRPSVDEKEKSSLWGRSLNPEALFFALKKRKIFSRAIRDIAGSRSAEVSPRPSVSSTHSSNSGLIQQHHIADPPRRSLDVLPRRSKNSSKNKGVALESLLGFTMTAPAWSAKRPKKIDFWSDLCQQDDSSIAPVSADKAPQIIPPIQPKCDDLLPTSQEQGNPVQQQVPQSSAPSTVSCNKFVSSSAGVPPQQGWLDGYLDDMAGRLRTAGWKEDEICEMMVSSESSSSSNSYPSASLKNAIVPRQTRQAVMNGLAFKVQELSDSLKKSGWSVQDVAEALNATNLSLWAAASAAQQVLASSTHTFASTAGYIAAR